MSSNMKLIIICLIALFTAYTNYIISKPPEDPVSKKYVDEYNALKDKLLSQEEFENLRKKENEYLKERVENNHLEKSVEHIFLAKYFLIPIISIIWWIIGFKFGLSRARNAYIATVLMYFIMKVFLGYIEPLIYSTVFIVANVHSINKRSTTKPRSE